MQLHWYLVFRGFLLLLCWSSGFWWLTLARAESTVHLRAMASPPPPPTAPLQCVHNRHLQAMWEQFTLYQQASYTGKQCGHLQADASLPPQDTSHWEGLYPLLATVYTQKTPWHRVKDTPAVAAQHSLDTALDEWIQRYPSDASVWLSKAFVLFQANHLLQAKLATEQALTLEPHHQGALLLYADLLKAEGNPKQAYLYLKRVVALNEQSPPAKQALLQLQAYD